MISGLFSLPLASAEAADRPFSRSIADASEAFLAGPENALVRKLAEAAVSDPAAYNPLVLCGAAGVGKTSLAHSLASQRRVRLGLKDIIATTGVDLARGLAHAIETDAVADFRARNHRCDLLMIDDLHRLAGKRAAQEFLLATLDALQRRGTLVIVTLRKLPQAIDDISPMLTSRLSGGLVAPLAPPGAVARRALVRQAAARVGRPLSDEVVELLAGATGRLRLTTASKLRNAVFELSIAADAQHRPIRPVHVMRWLDAQVSETNHLARRVVALVGRQAGLSTGELLGKSREQSTCNARALAIYIVRRLSGDTYAQIGRQFSGRDHTTVLHACRKIERLKNRDESLQRLIDELAGQAVADEED